MNNYSKQNDDKVNKLFNLIEQLNNQRQLSILSKLENNSKLSKINKSEINKYQKYILKSNVTINELLNQGFKNVYD
jgi:hypothetical protein